MKNAASSEGGDIGSDHEASRQATFVRPPQSLVVRFGKWVRDPINAWFASQSTIPTKPVVDSSHLPALAQITPHWKVIREEAAHLLMDQGAIPAFGKISPDHRRIASDGKWKSHFFEGYGYKATANREACPQTAALLDKIPGLVSAFFSIMDGDTHVPRHRGLTKAWLNCHLPIIVPRAPGRCEMQVANQTVQWREGEWLVFDETFPHEVWNTTGELRVVLMLQVRRPMRWPGKALAKAIYTAIRHTGFVQDVRRALDSR